MTIITTIIIVLNREIIRRVILIFFIFWDQHLPQARISRMKATMSPFGLVMTALLGWGSDVTAAFITRRDYGKHHTAEQEDNEDPHQRQGV